MPSDLKLSSGYETIEEEFEASLRRAFVDGKADYVAIYSRREQFLLESANYGVERGWLTGKLEQQDEQSSRYCFRLTDEGRAHFGLISIDQNPRIADGRAIDE